MLKVDMIEEKNSIFSYYRYRYSLTYFVLTGLDRGAVWSVGWMVSKISVGISELTEKSIFGLS